MSPTAEPPTRSNPYVGPRPFQRDDREFFFGRDVEARQLLSLVLSERMVLFYAQSGAGKSSLINARLIDYLESEQNFFVLPVGRVSGRGTQTPDGQKVANVFIYSLLNDINDKTSEGEKPATTPDMRLSEYLHLYSGQAPPESSDAMMQLETLPQILIVDQFEELFTTHPAEWKKREDFFLQIRQALEDDPKLWVLFALREDFIAAVDPYAYLFPGRLRARFYMQRLNENAACQAISQPANKAGRQFETEAVQELVRRLRLISTATPGEEELDQFVEPLFLQVVCYNLWEGLAGKPEAEAINRADLEVAGNIDDAWTTYYENLVLKRVLAEYQPGSEGPLSEMALRLWIENNLYSTEGQRRFVYEDQIAASILPAVKMLFDKRLLYQGQRDRRNWYELAHDRLVRPIRAANDEWWSKQGLLAMAARAWLTSNRKESALALDPALESAIELADEQAQDPLVVEFLIQARKKFKRDLATTGWGVIFAENTDPAVRQALQKLLLHRRRQATKHSPHYYRELSYRPGMTLLDFLKDNNATEGTSDPDLVPYFLLIVGDPESIPFTFQYQLDVDYAVGRIWFEHTADYAAYAHSVVEAESKSLALEPHAVFFSPSHAEIQATTLAIERLVHPSIDVLQKTNSDWKISALITPLETGKAQLTQLLGGAETPALLFTTSMSPPYPKESPFLLQFSGALITSDWPGPPAPFNNDQSFSAKDVSADAKLLGLIAFFMTDRSAGTPRLSNFSTALGVKENKELADRDFIARLPMRLLSHPSGGALAVVGHIDTAYSYSIRGLSGQGKSKVFQDTLARLLSGLPVGAAMDAFNQRYTMLAAMMFGLQSQAAQVGDRTSQARETMKDLRELEKATIDARNYIILGDPAVRLQVRKRESAQAARPVLHPPLASQDVRYHPGAVSCGQWSPDGKFVFTVCQDGGLRIWHANTPSIAWNARLIDQPFTCAAWSPDGKQIAALTVNGETILYDHASAGKEVARLSPGPDQGGRLAWSPDGLQLAITSDILRGGTYLARLWDIASGQVKSVLRGHTGTISAISYHPNGKWLLTASQDGSARLWSASGEQLAVFGLANGAPASQAEALVAGRFSHAGDQIIIASARGEITLVRTQLDGAWKVEDSWNSDQPLCNVAFSPDGASLVEANPAGTARSYQIKDRVNLLEFRGHSGAVNASEFNLHGNRLFTAGADGDLRLWYLPLRLPNPGGTVNLACYSPDSTRLASTYAYDRLTVWEVEGMQRLFDINLDPRLMTNLIFSPDSASLVTSDRLGFIRIWDAKDGNLRQEISCNLSGNANLIFSPDSRLLLGESAEKKIILWDVADGSEQFSYQANSFTVRAGFSPDGLLFYLLNLEGRLELIDWRSDSPQSLQFNTPGGIRCADFDPKSALIATGDDRDVHIWRASDGSQAQLLEGHQGQVNHVAFSPDGEKLLSASSDHSVRIWDLAQRCEHKAFCDSPAEVIYAAFSPDARSILACWWRNVEFGGSGLLAWDTHDERQFLNWSLPMAGPFQATLRPDGKQVMVLTRQGVFLLPFCPGLLPTPAYTTPAYPLSETPAPLGSALSF